ANVFYQGTARPRVPQAVLSQSTGKPFLMYPRFIQLFLNKQLEGVTRPQHFLPSVTLPSKVFTFMRKNSPKFSGRITPLTPPMLEVITALAAEEAHSESTHSRAESSPRDAQGTPTQSAAQASILQGTADFQGTAEAQSAAQASILQGTADFQGTAEAQGAADIPQSPNDYTPTDESQTSGGDEGLLDLYALNREVRRLKKQTISQAKQIHKLKAKLKKLSKGGPSSQIHPTQEEEPEEQFKDDEFLADIPLNRPRGLSIPGPMQSLQQIRALETANDEEVARKVQAEWDAEEERKGWKI
ncbi:hypothetical protein Tco_1381396, partial [Tanacetum coccineum]